MSYMDFHQNLGESKERKINTKGGNQKHVVILLANLHQNHGISLEIVVFW